MEIVGTFLQEFERPKEYIYSVTASHKKIYNAIEKRNMTGAKEEMEEHLPDVKNQFSILLGKVNRKVRGRSIADLSK